MGAVYLARDEALERLVAIKVLRPELAPNAESRERFRREALVAAQLNHPNIVPLLSIGDVGGLTYLVMGYVQGETLSGRLRREKTLPPGDVRRVIADIADALGYAHRKSIVHRDVKPDNILLDDETGRALLADFGIAKAVAAERPLTAAGGVLGTPFYMSPEQAQGLGTIDARSDLYSLGLTAYEMLIGRRAFDGVEEPSEVLRRGLTSTSTRGIPGDLAGAIVCCLQREPSSRWSDAAALRESISPASFDDDRLPDPLDALDGTAPLLLGLVLAGLATMLISLVNYRGFTLAAFANAPFAIPLCVSAVLLGLIVAELPLLASAVAAARGGGISLREIWNGMWRQPEWWGCLWYPASWRRPTDVWQRLPRAARAWRLTMTGFATSLALALFISIGTLGAIEDGTLWGSFLARLPAGAADAARVAGYSVAAMLAILVAAFAISSTLCFHLVGRRGLDPYSERRVLRTLLTSSTSKRSNWKSPEVFRFLLPIGSARGDSRTRTYEVLEKEILGLVRNLPCSVRAEGEGAAGAAASLLAAIRSDEGRIRSLMRAAAGKERMVLQRRIASLQRADAQDSPMRDLLIKQLALFDEMADRLPEIRANQVLLQARLRDLRRAVGALSRDPLDAGALAEVRALVAEAEKASRTVDASPEEVTSTLKT
jgi:hypothetical protein